MRRVVASVLAVVVVAAVSPAVRADATASRATALESSKRLDSGRSPASLGGVADRWLGALNAYRLKDYSLALERFSAVASDRGQTDWVRAGADFWAARVATALGDEARANVFLKLAATFPHTFYGIIAQRRLGSLAASAPSAGPPLISLTQFPRPELVPEGGFTVSKALVYALVRQESRFNAAAIGGGAYGLMQLTPATASRVSGDDRFRREPRRLHDAGANLRVGQDYVTRLLASAKGDLLQAMAAYNCGPGILKKFGVRLDGVSDPLLMIESLPVASARDFAERVMANYWTYRQIFGLASPTLDAAALGTTPLLASLDD